MASFVSFAPSATLQILKFDDVDDYRRAVRKFQLEFTPLSRRISAEQAILHLPGFDLSLIQAFPRLVNTQLAPDSTAICFSMDQRLPLRINGVDMDRAIVALGHGGDRFTALEEAAVRTVAIVFNPEIHDRGWPETRREFSMLTTTTSALQRLRLLVLEVMNFASASGDAAVMPATAAGMKESLLAASDQVFGRYGPQLTDGSLHSARLLGVYRKIEDYLGQNLGNPIYSNELSRQIGVPVRTLQDVVRLYHGMSLHRYLRLKRLWLVRQRLLMGHISVKACALAFGFWHLSDFSRSYRLHFEETPSETLARAH
jgi:AraC-like DNA-binding protein